MAEPAACPSLTRGLYAYDFGDTAHLTPLVKMHTLGSAFIPPGFHAGGLRYHGMSPMVSHALKLGLIEAEAYHQDFAARNPVHPYIVMHDAPKVSALQRQFPEVYAKDQIARN